MKTFSTRQEIHTGGVSPDLSDTDSFNEANLLCVIQTQEDLIGKDFISISKYDKSNYRDIYVGEIFFKR
ncbi:MAG: hypothetical protein IPL53_20965 [Ignavibacteria bacterium]|nr:hypothetical protein [Ignavibacteria bacterium]